MSQVSSDHPQASEATPAGSSTPPNTLSRPGWPEVGIGLVVLAAIAVGVALLAGRLGLDPWSTDSSSPL